MVSYQRQRSRSTVGIEPHIRQWKTYKKERAGKRFERERERDGKTNLWTIDQKIRMAFFKHSFRIITNLSMLKSMFSPK